MNKKGSDLYILAVAEGITMIPFPLLDKLFHEVIGMGFCEWQKRKDVDFPKEQILHILKERYRDYDTDTAE